MIITPQATPLPKLCLRMTRVKTCTNAQWTRLCCYQNTKYILKKWLGVPPICVYQLRCRTRALGYYIRRRVVVGPADGLLRPAPNNLVKWTNGLNIPCEKVNRTQVYDRVLLEKKRWHPIGLLPKKQSVLTSPNLRYPRG